MLAPRSTAAGEEENLERFSEIPQMYSSFCFGEWENIPSRFGRYVVDRLGLVYHQLLEGTQIMLVLFKYWFHPV